MVSCVIIVSPDVFRGNAQSLGVTRPGDGAHHNARNARNAEFGVRSGECPMSVLRIPHSAFRIVSIPSIVLRLEAFLMANDDDAVRSAGVGRSVGPGSPALREQLAGLLEDHYDLLLAWLSAAGGLGRSFCLHVEDARPDRDAEATERDRWAQLEGSLLTMRSMLFMAGLGVRCEEGVGLVFHQPELTAREILGGEEAHGATDREE